MNPVRFLRTCSILLIVVGALMVLETAGEILLSPIGQTSGMVMTENDY